MAIGECIADVDPRRELAAAQAQAQALLAVIERCNADGELEVLAEGALERLLTAVDAVEHWLARECQVSLVPGVPPVRQHQEEVAHA